MSRSKFLAATMLAVIGASGAAQDKRPAMISMNGVGTHSCGKYLEFRQSRNETMSNLYQQWAAGYFAGYSDAVTKPGTTTNLAADLETYTAWLDKWCADDPLATVSAGIINMRMRLVKQK
jgi:hypothetical protein